MKLHIVHQDDISLDQFRDEKMLDVKIKDLRANCPFDGHHRLDPTEAHGAQDRSVGAVMPGFTDLGALTLRGAGVGPCHRGFDCELVDEDQSLDWQPHCLFSNVALSTGSALSSRFDFFFDLARAPGGLARSSECSPR